MADGLQMQQFGNDRTHIEERSVGIGYITVQCLLNRLSVAAVDDGLFGDRGLGASLFVSNNNS